MPTGTVNVGKDVVAERASLSRSVRAALRYMAAGASASKAASRAKIDINGSWAHYVETQACANELRKECQFRLETKLVPLALCVLELAMKPGNPMKTRLESAKLILDRGGFAITHLKSVELGSGESIEAMSREELHAFVKSAEAKLAELATPVQQYVADGTAEDELDDAMGGESRRCDRR